jgi:hypothetical protein
MFRIEFCLLDVGTAQGQPFDVTNGSSQRIGHGDNQGQKAHEMLRGVESPLPSETAVETEEYRISSCFGDDLLLTSHPKIPYKIDTGSSEPPAPCSNRAFFIGQDKESARSLLHLPSL